METLKELIASDRTLMLPAIGALGEVALTDALKPEVSAMAFGALPLADEAALPTLVRVLLGSASGTPAVRTLRGMRAQIGTVSSGTLMVLRQVVLLKLLISQFLQEQQQVRLLVSHLVGM